MAKKQTKALRDIQPGEYVLLGSFWLRVTAISDDGESVYHPEKHLAKISGYRRHWTIEDGESSDFDEFVCQRGTYYLDSVLRWLPAEA